MLWKLFRGGFPGAGHPVQGVLHGVAHAPGGVLGPPGQVLPGVGQAPAGGGQGAAAGVALGVVAVYSAAAVGGIGAVGPVIQGTAGLVLLDQRVVLVVPAVGGGAGVGPAAAGGGEAKGEDESGGHQFSNHTFPPCCSEICGEGPRNVVCAAGDFLEEQESAKNTTCFFLQNVAKSQKRGTRLR